MNPPDQSTPAVPSAGRYHGLDALRAFALWLGVAYHAAMSLILPPGFWAVGTAKPPYWLDQVANYLHSFRMEVFFLLAGFFASLMLQRKGVRGFLRDRAARILAVLVVFAYPVKFCVTALWIDGGIRTGWLPLPPEAKGLPRWQLILGGVLDDTFPDFSLAHLWFLYYLFCISLLAVFIRGLLLRSLSPRALNGLGSSLANLLQTPFAPLLLGLVLYPLLRNMQGLDIDTPSETLIWIWPVLLLYGCFFGLGYLTHQYPLLLQAWGRWAAPYLIVSVIASYFAQTIRVHASQNPNFYLDPVLLASTRRLTAPLVSVTMATASLGMVGLFVRFFNHPRPWVRYLADSSYWIYLAHLPLVVALQIMVHAWPVHWFVKLLTIIAVAVPLLLLSYHFLVRNTWLGVWLNGRRPTRQLASEAIGNSATALPD